MRNSCFLLRIRVARNKVIFAHWFAISIARKFYIANINFALLLYCAIALLRYCALVLLNILLKNQWPPGPPSQTLPPIPGMKMRHSLVKHLTDNQSHVEFASNLAKVLLPEGCQGAARWLFFQPHFLKIGLHGLKVTFFQDLKYNCL